VGMQHTLGPKGMPTATASILIIACVGMFKGVLFLLPIDSLKKATMQAERHHNEIEALRAELAEEERNLNNENDWAEDFDCPTARVHILSGENGTAIAFSDLPVPLLETSSVNTTVRLPFGGYQARKSCGMRPSVEFRVLWEPFPGNVGDKVRASTAMPRETMDDLGITADDEGQVTAFNTAQDQASVRWKRLGNTAWCNKSHLQVIGEPDVVLTPQQHKGPKDVLQPSGSLTLQPLQAVDFANAAGASLRCTFAVPCRLFGAEAVASYTSGPCHEYRWGDDAAKKFRIEWESPWRPPPKVRAADSRFLAEEQFQERVLDTLRQQSLHIQQLEDTINKLNSKISGGLSP